MPSTVETCNMPYFLYNATPNTVGVEPYVGIFECDNTGCTTRYIEVQSQNVVLKYDASWPADTYGMLPEGTLPENEMYKPQYGPISEITEELFVAFWNCMKATNR
jgi:hypothetical protein